MRITKERVMILCGMARDGAKDDGGREFALGMLEAFQETWRDAEEAQAKQGQMAEQAKMETRLRTEREKAIEQYQKDALAPKGDGSLVEPPQQTSQESAGIAEALGRGVTNQVARNGASKAK